MHYCQFRAGEIVIGVETPEKLDMKEPYNLFLTENEKENVLVRFGYISEISVVGRIVAETETFVLTEDEENQHFYYRVSGGNEYYAERIVKKDNPDFYEILIPEKYTGKIWTRLVFSLINIEDLACRFNASVFHSSVIDIGGEAILFTAPCGTGKSTQAALWEKYRNAFVVNGDKSMIYEKDGVCLVSGVPFSGSSDICHNKILPVKAVVRLSQAKENKVEQLKGFNAYKSLHEGCYHSKWNADYEKNTADLIEKFVLNVPVLSLACLPDESAVEELENFLDKQ